jgi:hypothetical protein
MSTFGGVAAAELSTSYPDEFPRRPRRLAAVSAFGVLALMGAAGSYFAVVNGLGSLLSEKPATAEAHPYPLAAGDPAAASTAGLGETRSARRAAVALPAPRTTAATPTPPPARVLPPPAHRTRPERTGRPGGAGCDCLTPPVPTPTAPSAPSATPTTPASPSPSPSSSATGGTSASPSPSDTTGDGAFHPKRHARGD